MESIASEKIKTSLKFQEIYRFVEHKVSLEDSLAQISTEPNEFSMLNLDKLDNGEVPIGIDDDALITFLFDLSQRVKIEKRVVTSIPALFGELGGLNDFLATIVVILIGNLQ